MNKDFLLKTLIAAVIILSTSQIITSIALIVWMSKNG